MPALLAIEMQVLPVEERDGDAGARVGAEHADMSPMKENGNRAGQMLTFAGGGSTPLKSTCMIENLPGVAANQSHWDHLSVGVLRWRGTVAAVSDRPPKNKKSKAQSKATNYYRKRYSSNNSNIGCHSS